MDDFFGAPEPITSSAATATATATDADPLQDFLAREQAVLGEDAALFSVVGEVDPLSLPTTTDDFTSAATAITTPGSSSSIIPHQQSPSEPSFPPTTTTTTITQEVEPEVIRMWRQDFEQSIATKDAKSKDKHTTILKDAKEALERFYAEYNDKKDKAIQKNRAAEKRVREEESNGTTIGTAGNNVWDRVVKQIDFSSQIGSINPARDAKLKEKLAQRGISMDISKDGKDKRPASGTTAGSGGGAGAGAVGVKGRDTARMKQVLMSLKKDPKAPGNGGILTAAV